VFTCSLPYRKGEQEGSEHKGWDYQPLNLDFEPERSQVAAASQLLARYLKRLGLCVCFRFSIRCIVMISNSGKGTLVCGLRGLVDCD
jgi:hypothetical protein